MRREEAIEIMNNAILEMNRKMAEEQNIPSQQIDMTLDQMKPQLTEANGLIFDALYDNGVINLHN